ncbi:P-loop containing nucleoside triphosphate hydrolase protein [Mycena pura]|uniref:DNA 3'-5' helicase n=1 Tax=Mycena pura TaxID=153505 RepID=A0AAD6Y5R4_9AGAR|nr:P-loop containing nucleoside triphosphate hydrolase protein [Mycena pura]
MLTPQPQTPRKRDARPPSGSPRTPRRRARKTATRLQGTSSAKLSYAEISTQLIALLALTFIPELWQIYLISRILRGFDSVFLAGTGYGKSLVFEGLAVLGGKNKVVIVICPLKALERDQVSFPPHSQLELEALKQSKQVIHARKKGINAILINEDNTKTASLWKEARTTAQLVYISPEMACSDSFVRLWKDPKFRGRITALIVDEAHCIDEWGDEFRPEYKKLEMLRSYTGQGVPFVACTATASTSTFDTIWNSLGFGNRPFWGLDVGCGRNNLLYLTRSMSNPQNPVLDVLNYLPETLDDNTPREAVDKMLFYFDSETACGKGVNTVRSALPAHLRDCVYAFSSGISEDAKKDCWEGFMSGRYRIICCTDAAGMGCNVHDVKITIIFDCPSSLAVLSQRWGRTGRGRGTIGTCLLLVRSWAFRPIPASHVASAATVQQLQQLRGQKKAKLEPQGHTTSRGKIESTLEAFINSGLAAGKDGRCSHRIMARVFRPWTGLSIFDSLDATTPTSVGELSRNSAYELQWTQIDLPGKTPPDDRCCGVCNPALLASFRPSSARDHRLRQFAAEFIHPLAEADPEPELRPTSPSSAVSDNSTETVEFEPLAKGQAVSKADKEMLRARLVEWRALRHKRRGASKFISAEVALPPRTLEALVTASGKFLSEAVIGKKQILAVVKHWDFGTDDDFRDVAEIICDWRTIFVSMTPQSQRRTHKRTRSSHAPGQCAHSAPAITP